MDNLKKIIKIIRADEDDLEILITKGFVMVFEREIIVITHWKINNFIRKDWYKSSMYIEQKQQLYKTGNVAYILTQQWKHFAINEIEFR